MDYAEFDKKKRLPQAPLFAMVGEEPFLKRRAVNKVLSHFSREPEGALAVRTFDPEGPEPLRPGSVDEVFTDVKTPSLFAKKTMVVVWRADKLFTRGGGAEALLEYLENPGGGGALVLELRSLDKRTRVGRAIRDRGVLVECKRLYDRPPPWKPYARAYETPLAEWIAAEGKKEHLRFPLPVAQGLAERVGNDLGALHAEVQKLGLYLDAGPGQPRDVDALALSESVGDYNEFGVFRLTDAVGRRDLPTSLRIARSLLEQGLRSFGAPGKRVPPPQVPAVLLGRIHAKLREIFQARSVLDTGGSSEDVGRVLKKHRAFLPVLVEEAGRFDPSETPRILDLLFE
ncbi:MAG: DNA polymerase III subunit delta, partial [Planctomycetota bacterium]